MITTTEYKEETGAPFNKIHIRKTVIPERKIMRTTRKRLLPVEKTFSTSGVFRSLIYGLALASIDFKQTRLKKLTESRIQHVQRHLVTLLGSRDGHQTLIAAFLRLVDLDHTATQVPNLINLGPTFPDDSTDHVVGNVNLLR